MSLGQLSHCELAFAPLPDVVLPAGHVVHASLEFLTGLFDAAARDAPSTKSPSFPVSVLTGSLPPTSAHFPEVVPSLLSSPKSPSI